MSLNEGAAAKLWPNTCGNVLFKYHALGNDYLVVKASAEPEVPTKDTIKRWCHRHIGVGADGVLVHLPSDKGCVARLLIFNPDGSQAEKSGNGLRIFARYLWDFGHTHQARVIIELMDIDIVAELFDAHGAPTRCHDAHHLDFAKRLERVENIGVSMGEAKLTVDAMHMPKELGYPTTEHVSIEVAGRRLDATCVSMGNPHCVVFNEAMDLKVLEELGPLLEHHAWFRQRTNVQLVRVINRAHIEIMIWERGVGMTQASGTSSCAASVACFKRHLVDDDVAVHMPGGVVHVSIDDTLKVRLLGSAQFVCRAEVLAHAA